MIAIFLISLAFNDKIHVKSIRRTMTDNVFINIEEINRLSWKLFSK